MSTITRGRRSRRAALALPLAIAVLGGVQATAVSTATAAVPYESCSDGTLTDPFHVKAAYEGVGLYANVDSSGHAVGDPIERLEAGMCVFRRVDESGYEDRGPYTVVRRGTQHGSAVWGYILRDAIY